MNHCWNLSNSKLLASPGVHLQVSADTRIVFSGLVEPALGEIGYVGLCCVWSPIVKFMQLVLKRDVEMSPLQDDGSNPSHPSFELNRRTIPECLIFQRSSGAAVQCLPMFFSPNQSIWRYMKMTNQSVAPLHCVSGIWNDSICWQHYEHPIVPFCIRRLVQWSPGQVMCSSSSPMRSRVSLWNQW